MKFVIIQTFSLCLLLLSCNPERKKSANGHNTKNLKTTVTPLSDTNSVNYVKNIKPDSIENSLVKNKPAETENTKEDQEKEDNNQPRKLKVKMEEDNILINEVIVSGYGTLQKSNVPGTASSINNYAPSFRSHHEHASESYKAIDENNFQYAMDNPLSTFSIDVDGASYTNSRRIIKENGSLPPKDAVRIEEFINYFSYNYPQPNGEHPFSITTEYSECPWNKDRQLVHIGLQGKKFEFSELAPMNLVFLIDVSGSMDSPDKLPMLKQAFKLLINNLRPEDRIAIVVYAGAAGLVLPSTAGSGKKIMYEALEKLSAGGSTAGGQGIKLAYDVAKQNYSKKGINRVIMATDGDFNVGLSSDEEMIKLIEEQRESGVFLTTLGFGTGNYKDSKMEAMADHGNGNNFYIDNIQEAEKVFVTELDGTLCTIAKDVKLQVEFNPAKVKAYRLVGYENRKLNKEDFNNDRKDAGDLGAGHTVTALYEIIPAGSNEEIDEKVDDLKYQIIKKDNKLNTSSEILTVKFRYKDPEGIKSKLIVQTLEDKYYDLEKASDNFKFSAAVAGYGMLLRDSKYKGSVTYDEILNLAKESKGHDIEGYREEFVQMVKTTSLLSNIVQK